MGVDPVTALTVGGAILSGVSTIKQMGAQKDARKAERSAMETQRRADELRQNRERRQAIRESRMRNAAIIQSGANQGASTSSAVAGGSASMTSQLSTNLSFLDQQGTLNDITSGFNQQRLDALGSAETYGAAAGVGNSIFQAGGGWKTIFSAYQDKGTGGGGGGSTYSSNRGWIDWN